MILIGISFADFSIGISVSEDWIDPFVGIRWKWQINDKVDLMMKGAIEGLWGSSDLVWEGTASSPISLGSNTMFKGNSG